MSDNWSREVLLQVTFQDQESEIRFDGRIGVLVRKRPTVRFIYENPVEQVDSLLKTAGLQGEKVLRSCELPQSTLRPAVLQALRKTCIISREPPKRRFRVCCPMQ